MSKLNAGDTPSIDSIHDAVAALQDTTSVVVSPGWTVATLGAGFTNFGAPYLAVAYRRDSAGNVRLRGIASKGSAFSAYPGDVIFQLPDGYRPLDEPYIGATTSGNVLSQLLIRPNGEVRIAGGTTWVSLYGVSFPAEILATYVMLGDSITNGFGSSNGGWPTQFGVLAGARAQVIQKGVNGNTITQAEARRTTDVDPSKPSFALLQAGINDVLADASAATIITRMTTTLSAFVASGYTPAIATIPPFKNYVSFTAARETVRTAVNAWVRANPAYKLLDLDAALTDNGAVPALKAAYDSGDGLHPNNAGTVAVATTIFAQLLGSRAV